MARAPAGSPCSGPFLGIIDEILADDKEAPPKQRHTAKRIFERLRDEHGYTGCYSQVQTAVQRPSSTRRRPSSRSAIRPATPSSTSARPWSRSPASACKAALAVITLPYSDTYFLVRLSARVHRDLPGRPRGRLRVLRRRAHCGPPMTTPPSPSPRSSGRERELTREFLAPREPLSLRPPLLPGGTGQREGPRREPRRLSGDGTSWSRSRRSPPGPR